MIMQLIWDTLAHKKLITYEGPAPKVNYQAAYQKNEIVEYKIVR